MNHFYSDLQKPQGLYDPALEHDACGVGFVVNVKGKKSHSILINALQVLVNLNHRGACGCEPNTGDGAGVLIQIPHRFFVKICSQEKISLPAAGEYGAGIVFLPRMDEERKDCEKILEKIVREEGQEVLGWRTVPTDNAALGATAKAGEPVIKQVFIRQGTSSLNELAFERKLFVIRKRAENAIRDSQLREKEFFYICSLSARTLVYKGMLTAEQLEGYYPDLKDATIETAIALVHSRFSTNTFPSWKRAHPYRLIAHNGEINTLRGNVNWMHAREGLLSSPLLGDDIKKILPIIDESGSDTAMFDNTLEFLSLSGRSLPHAMMMMIPEPWQNHATMSDEKKAFYEFHECLMEPWDGPASIAFTDGVRIGAVLDRNGLRPSRYYVTQDDHVIMASEVGVLEIPPEQILYKGRLQPGRMFLIDTSLGKIVSDEEIKHQMASTYPYRQWLKTHRVAFESLAEGKKPATVSHLSLIQQQKLFGYTYEDLCVFIQPISQNGVDTVGSMGDDTPLSVLSDKPHLLYNYFKQLFAQVTNPPLDSNFEALVTASEILLGSEGNLLEPRAEDCRRIKIKSPLMTDTELEKLKALTLPGFKTATFPIHFSVEEGGAGLEQSLEKLFRAVSQAIIDGINIIVLSDRETREGWAPIPALLAVSALHHHLIRKETRTRVSLILDSGEPREVHHFSLLLGYGADAVHPYLVFDSIHDLIEQEKLNGLSFKEAEKHYLKAIVKGVIKVASKMGISTLQSYRGAQIFEAIGINSDVIKKYFTWTASRIEGIGLSQITAEVKQRYERAYFSTTGDENTLEEGGRFQWRKDGERHLFNPKTVHLLQRACRNNHFETFQEYSKLVNDQTRDLYTLRGLLDLKFAERAIPLEEVEAEETIVRRFKSGAMSYGSISKEAHETLAVAMNRIGGKSNTGEGGEDPSRYEKLENGDSKNSAIKQVASGRFGVTSEYLVQARELQIKMAQGAKPGEGGQLPGRKVYPWIARVRLSTPGVGLISPPPHHDIYSIEDLAELIHDLKNANPDARISVKLVSEVGVGTVAAGVAKGHADVVLISGHDGGTGASPLTSIKYAGLPWELGLAETHQTLVLNNLRSRIAVETDGQLKTGRDVVIAALLGAEEFGFATAPLVALGCIMMRVCHLDTCPVGVATQNPELRKKFTGDPAQVVNFMYFIAREVRQLMAQLGFRTINEMVGRVDKLEPRQAVEHWKARGLDFSKLLHQPEVPPGVGRYCQIPQDHGLDKSLDRQVLLKLCQPALEKKQMVRRTLPIKNFQRVVGTMLGSEITRRHGKKGLPEDTIRLHFQGSAGQSFGAFIPAGLTLELEGDANDYFGKGLSGGKLIAYPPKKATFKPEENILIGNVAFYGATSGEAYVRGLAGERFCVRNSGVKAVVEGVGDHGCEYMTEGRVVVLGPSGRNFAAGMSGGIAYVLDEVGDFSIRCNLEMVELFPLEDPAEINEIKTMLERHVHYTDSTVGRRLLSNWEELVKQMIKVYPKDYQRAHQAMTRVQEQGLSGEDAVMAAFTENIKDVARVVGN